MKPAAATTTAASSDHERVIGRFGVGFFGVMTAPSGTDDIPAPTLGFRYWLKGPSPKLSFLHIKTVGVEAAVGLGFKYESNNGDSKTTLAMAFHGGLPLALAYSSHFTFIGMPEANFAFSSGDQGSGVMVELGLRTGAEVHFGFMGLPDLALQASVAVSARYEYRAQGTLSVHDLTVATSLGGSPWDIFTGNVTAIYYY